MMIIDRNYEGLIDEGWRYEIEGNLECDEEIDIKLDKELFVSGWIYAGYWLKAGYWIKAGRWIEAGYSIYADHWIEADDWIKAGGWIEAGDSIRAGDCIEADDWIKAGDSSGISAGLWIICSKLKGGVVESGILVETGEAVQPIKEMTVEEIEKLVGSKVKIIAKEEQQC